MQTQVFIKPFFPSKPEIINVSTIEEKVIGLNKMIQEINKVEFKTLSEMERRDKLRQELNGLCYQLKYPSIYR